MTRFAKALRAVLPMAAVTAMVLTFAVPEDAEARHWRWRKWKKPNRRIQPIRPVRPKPVPELDPTTAAGALIVLVGGAAIAFDRRRKPVMLPEG